MSRYGSGEKGVECEGHGRRFAVHECMRERRGTEGEGIKTSTLTTNEGATKS